MQIYPTPYEVEAAFSQIAAGYPSDTNMIEDEIEQNVHDTEVLVEYLDEPFVDIIE